VQDKECTRIAEIATSVSKSFLNKLTLLGFALLRSDFVSRLNRQWVVLNQMDNSGLQLDFKLGD
jgi:hypothetical protein